MYQGIASEGIEFYELLMESSAFCSELGRVALAAGRLEAELILLLKRNNVEGNYQTATLGKLISILKKENILEENVALALKEECGKRNYLTHNIYALFIELIDETMLERTDLLDSDVHTYTERAWQLRKNLIGLCEIVKKYNNNV